MLVQLVIKSFLHENQVSLRFQANNLNLNANRIAIILQNCAIY